MSTTTIEWTEYTDDDDEIVHELPATFEVCPRCRGAGSHVNPAIDGHGITMDEWENEWSPDEQDTYLSGGYDVTCYECKGLRVVKVVDEAACDPQLLKAYHRHLREEAEYQRMCEMERRYGA